MNDREGTPGGKQFGPNNQNSFTKDLVKEVHDYFARGAAWEGTWRKRALEDLMFCEGDAYNNYQWPADIRQARENDKKPCITINRVRQHCLQITNDMKQNKPEVRLSPTGGQATLEGALIYEQVIRHICYQSDFQQVLDQASEFQVKIGFGAMHLTTDWSGPDSFDQDIFIRPMPDPLAVIIDPNCKMPDKSDMDQCLIFDTVDKDAFEQTYPRFKDQLPTAELVGLYAGETSWMRENQIRVGSYYWREYEEDVLFEIPNQGNLFESEINEMILPMVKADPRIRRRKMKRPTVKYALIVGNQVVETNDWAGQFIPVIPLIGEETLIQGKLDRKGHVRAMLDPQRMYNYWASSAVEFGALQSKIPYIISDQAIMGFERFWKQANTRNLAYLPYRAYDENGQQQPRPERAQPPVSAPLYLDGMKQSQMEMMMVSGQFQNQFGEPGNERSGKAIEERQRQGDNATYHYIDHQAVAVRNLGRQLLDLIPKIYTNQRVVQMMMPDGKTTMPVMIDPQAQQVLAQADQQAAQLAQLVFNPGIGKYGVIADVGPAYATKREQAFNAISQLLMQRPELAAVIGDILLKNADFPGAEEAAQRLARLVPPQALGQGPSPQDQQLQAEVQQMQKDQTKLIDELAKLRIKLVGKEEKREIEVYEAETNRLKTLISAGQVAPEQTIGIAHKLMNDMNQTHIDRVAAEAQRAERLAGTGQTPLPAAGTGKSLAEEPPVEGAQKSPKDGQWYVPNPLRAGKWMRVKKQGE